MGQAGTARQPVRPAPEIPGLVYRGYLSSGGFADVFLYESASPVRPVAVKVLHAGRVDPGRVQALVNEANAMAALEHPHIARVYDTGVTGDGRPYIEMAYYPLGTLAAAIVAGPLAVAEVLKYGVQLASAVAAAHQIGLLHRDIKPANVLIDNVGDAALSDFSIAAYTRGTNSAQPSLSVPWSAPEAIRGSAPLDQTGDIFSLSATLWNALARRSPFEVPGADNRTAAVMTRICSEEPAPLGRADAPASLEQWLRRGLSKDPRARPGSAVEFARGLNTIETELWLRTTPFKMSRATPSPVEADRGALTLPPEPWADVTRVRPAR
jgi:serine/threonine protein kinase